MSKHPDNDILGPAPWTHWSATSEDDPVPSKRQRLSDTPSGSSGSAAPGPRPAGQPGQRGAETPSTSQGIQDIQRVANDLEESDGEDSPSLD